MNKKNDLEILKEKINSCHICELCKLRNKTVPGEGSFEAKIMFIGEAPGKVNDETGKPFIGYGGKIFDKILLSCGVKREDVFITNTVKCWPPKNRRPKRKEIDKCKTYLDEQIEIINPCLIITLGSVAYNTLTDKPIKMKEQHGILEKINGIFICPTFHPNGLRYIKGGMQTIINDINNAKSLLENLPKS